MYMELIPQNIATQHARRIGIYNPDGNRIGQMPLGVLTPPNRKDKMYTFGTLSDVHIGQITAEPDFKRALAWLPQNADFVCISGDLIHGDANSAAAQIEIYKNCLTNVTIPVYAISGNHDGYYVEDIETTIESYSGNPLYYTIEKGDDVFIFVGVTSSEGGKLFTVAELQWLYETLEANRNRRCFLFEHVRPDDACGNALGIYTYDIWGGTEQTVFESLLRHYHNVIFFHGHSHLKFDLQRYDKAANIDRIFGCWSVHVPSISVPRGTNSVVDPTRVELYAESEGYVVDVYPTGIHLRGRDFVAGEYLPIASYWLDTTLQEIPAGTYTDPTGTIDT